ncbi:voltage-gated potassium channel Kch [Agromyces terreus]|uniref:Voltage-gated potassium channel Kch n=1 Tax=Agromyces terreus TaxID=424795 RepID=A0A9X2KAP0_9MICO|nr:hypothetical protein [Agromyces terreus]MCP2370538.1 voltage-gated potassium channel Kch [Agromyces terreus]
MPERPLTVIDEADAAAAAIATSAAMFDASPVAVVAPDAEAELAAGSKVATELGVPLLLEPSSAGDAADDAADALADELDRLGVTRVVAIGPDDHTGSASDDAGYGERDVVRVAGDDAPADAVDALPDFDAATTPAAAVVLVTDDDSAPAATARAARAIVEALPADDPNPQHSPDAIEALHAADGAPALAIGPEFAASDALDWQVRTARTGAQLPGGGQVLFPDRMLVAAYGRPDSPSLGILGEQPLDATITRAAALAATYDDLTDRTVLPALEIITTVASGAPTPDGDYSGESEPEDLVPWIEAAGAAGQYVVLDLQPGHDTFPQQLDEYRSLLAYPWVGLALDPEWRLDPGQRHLVDIGQVEASEVNEVIDRLAAICDEHDLPPKLLVLHQFRNDMILHREQIDVGRPEVDVLFHVDGNGTQPAKQATWNTLREGAPPAAWGWKNFIDEDAPMLTPEQTMREVSPAPDLVSYQ